MNPREQIVTMDNVPVITIEELELDKEGDDFIKGMEAARSDLERAWILHPKITAWRIGILKC